MSVPTSVYRYYDADGRLIYVGVTSRGPQRQAQHTVTDEGSVSGWQTGYSSGQDRAWREAHDHYTPAYLADMTIRIVVDGADNVPRAGHISLCVPGVEPGLAEMEAAIAEHGLSALVDKAAEGSKWARRSEAVPF
jgi:hypothetical protein